MLCKELKNQRFGIASSLELNLCVPAHCPITEILEKEEVRFFALHKRIFHQLSFTDYSMNPQFQIALLLVAAVERT
ncbi:hypothetical protein MKW98_009656 [Papaver atlanticum]|uniref:Uncharacterized protein n=1 Tax=Papaver atlanticum TaxID=357466 RepID=A0AAD4XDH0_9MAGN|nr:hypothetical protein MKW98_009656 [Papaver atlanticum]